jgi:phage shock protein A
MRKNLASQPLSENDQSAKIHEDRKSHEEGVLTSLSEAKKKIESDIASLETRKSILEKIVVDLKDDIETHKKDKEESSFSLGNHLKKNNTEKKLLNDSLTVLKDDIVSLNKNKLNLVEDNSHLLERKTNLENDINTLNASISSSILTKKDLEKNLDNINSDIEAKNIDIKDKEKILILLRGDRTVLEKDISDLEYVLSEKKTSVVALENTIATHKKEIADLDRDFNNLKESVGLQNQKLEEAKKEALHRESVASIAEKRVEEKTLYLLRLIDKAKADNLIKDFKI